MPSGTVERYEGHFRGRDHTELFYQKWSTSDSRGLFLITHGLAEHSECYHPLAKALAEDGWQVVAWDLRGHGRSEGKRGYVHQFEDYIQDLASVVRLAQSQSPTNQKIILFGHSMGGLVSIRALQQELVQPDAVVLGSPALGLSLEVPKLKESLARIAFTWMPTLTLANELNYELLSRDRNMVESYQRDTLRHDKISPAVFLGMLDAFVKAFESVSLIKLPLLMQVAGRDQVVSTERALEWFELVQDRRKQSIVYADSYHEIYNDLDRDQAIGDLRKFINPYLLKPGEGVAT